MYQNYADYKRWTFDIVNYTPAEIGTAILQRFHQDNEIESSVSLLCHMLFVSPGGLHHAAAHISGENVYRHLKYEGGTHRVQRIPEIGMSSRMQRIHTGTMSVIVLPQPEEVNCSLAW